MQADLERLWQEYQSDTAEGLSVPEWKDSQPLAAIPCIYYLITVERKSTALKSLQGKIWEQGYRDGTLRSQIFTDVKPANCARPSSAESKHLISSASLGCYLRKVEPPVHWVVRDCVGHGKRGRLPRGLRTRYSLRRTPPMGTLGLVWQSVAKR